MRIISGRYKGRRLTAPKQLPVRPTTDRAKEALFNILHHRFEWNEIRTLDLFAGTGNISYELASRGVNDLTAVDQNKYCVYYINQTAKALEMPIVVIKNNVEKFLEYPLHHMTLFLLTHLCVQARTINRIGQSIDQSPLGQNNGLIVVEHDKHITLNEHEYFSKSEPMEVVIQFFAFSIEKIAGHKPDSVVSYHLSRCTITRHSNRLPVCSNEPLLNADLLGVAPYRVYLISLQLNLYILSVALVLSAYANDGRYPLYCSMVSGLSSPAKAGSDKRPARNKGKILLIIFNACHQPNPFFIFEMMENFVVRP